MSKRNFKIAVLPGDGIGLEIAEQAVNVLKAVEANFGCSFGFSNADVGYTAYEKHGSCLPKETLDVCKKSDSILFGAVGDPRAEKLPAEEQPERAALLPLRKKFNLYANLRPAKVFDSLVSASSLKEEIVRGVDLLVVRELTGGLYFGKKDSGKDWASDEMKYTKSEIERIAKVAFELAKKRRGKLTSIDKANVLSAMLFWRNTVREFSKNYPAVKFDEMYVDNAAMQLIRNPKQFDVLLCGNMFGDILSDAAAMVTGSLGMLPSASLGEDSFGLYEPVHGSAPDIAGQNKANPLAMILSAGMMLRYSFNLQEEADALEKAVEKVLEKGYRTADILEKGKKLVGTKEISEKILEEI